MRAIPIGRKILLGSAFMVVVLVVVLAAFWNRDRGLSRAEYQNNVAILEAADGRRFLGYFVTAEKLVCLNTYCDNDAPIFTFQYECANPISLDTIRVVYPEVAITEIMFPTNYNYGHHYFVFKTTPNRDYVPPRTWEQRGDTPPRTGLVQLDYVMYDIEGSKPRAVEIIPVYHNPESAGGLGLCRSYHIQDENGNDTDIFPKPGHTSTLAYIGKDPDIENRLLSNRLSGLMFTPKGGCGGFLSRWSRPSGHYRYVSQDEILGSNLSNLPLMCEYDKMHKELWGD